MSIVQASINMSDKRLEFSQQASLSPNFISGPEKPGKVSDSHLLPELLS